MLPICKQYSILTNDEFKIIIQCLISPKISEVQQHPSVKSYAMFFQNTEATLL